MAQESSEEERNEEKEVVAEKDAQVMIEEKLEETKMGPDLQEPRSISISSRLLEKEKSKLIVLLKEYKDVFAWDSEID